MTDRTQEAMTRLETELHRILDRLEQIDARLVRLQANDAAVPASGPGADTPPNLAGQPTDGQFQNVFLRLLAGAPEDI